MFFKVTTCNLPYANKPMCTSKICCFDTRSFTLIEFKFNQLKLNFVQNVIAYWYL